MNYSELVEIYEKISETTKKLEKIDILSKFLPRLKGNEEWVYLLRGRVFPDYDEREFGISTQLTIKAIAKASGVLSEDIIESLKKVGDVGKIAEELVGKKRQSTLFSKKLKVEKVFGNLRKLSEIEGGGAVERKLGFVVELLTSASGTEAKYIVRTLLNDLRIGVAEATIRDSISKAFFEGDEKMASKIEEAHDLSNDFAEVLTSASNGKKGFEKIELIPGRAMKVMLPVKVTNLQEAFRICGKPLAVEHKYDGFRVVINKDEAGNVSLFTRRLDNVTKQFPDVVEVVKEKIKAKSFILDTEVVGYDFSKKKYLPFEAVSQRIRRKHGIEDLKKKLPVEINVFDIMYLDGKSVTNLVFEKRRKLLEKVVKSERWKVRLSKKFVSDSEEKIQKFYEDALDIGEEGVMLKNLKAPYKPGRRVGYMVKMKPDAKDLDLVIVGAEYGTGKRAGGLTSFIVACKSGEEFLEIGKVSSGLKEKKEMGTTYKEIDELLQPLIIKEEKNSVKLKPKVVLSVTYQNIQKSSKYSSGMALRFPRITHYRPERGIYDIASLKEIEKELDN